MATQTSIFYPTGEEATATLATVTSTAEIVVGNNRTFVVHASDDVHIKVGTAGMAAASTSNMRLDGGSYTTYDSGSHFDRIRLFNPTANTITYWIQFLAR